MLPFATVVVVRGCGEADRPLEPVGPELHLRGDRVEVEGSWFGLWAPRRFSAPPSDEVTEAILRTRAERRDGRPAGVVVGAGVRATDLARLDHALPDGVAARREGDERWWHVAVEPGRPVLSPYDEVLPRWDELTTGDALSWSFPPGGMAGAGLGGGRPPRPAVDLFARVTPDGVTLFLDPAMALAPPAPLLGELELEAAEVGALRTEVYRWSQVPVGWARLVGSERVPARLVVDADEDTPLSVIAGVSQGFAWGYRDGLVEVRTRFGAIELHDRSTHGPWASLVVDGGVVDLRRGVEAEDPRPCLTERCLADGPAIAGSLPSDVRLTLSAPALTLGEAWPLLVELRPDALGW